MNPRAKSVIPQSNFQLLITFKGGKRKAFDMRPFLGFGIFEELKDESYFKKAFVSFGTVAWPNGQDVCPDTLYEDGRSLS